MAYTSDRGTNSNLPTNDPYKAFLIGQKKAADAAIKPPATTTPAAPKTPSVPKTTTPTPSTPAPTTASSNSFSGSNQSSTIAPGSGLTINGVPYDPNVDDPNDAKYGTNTGIGGGGATVGGGSTIGTSSSDAMIQQKIDALAEAQKASTLAALDSQRTNTLNSLTKSMNTGLANLDTAQYNIGQSFYDQRNQAAGASDVGAYNYGQKAAALGIEGNAAMQPEIYRNVGLQNALSRLGASEAAQNAEIQQQRATLLNNYNSDLDAANQTYATGALAAGADSDMARLSAQIQAMKEQAAKADKQTAADRQMFLDTIGQYSNDYQAQYDKVANDGDPSNDWQLNYLSAARQDKIRELEAAKAAQQQQDFENALAMQKATASGGTSTPTQTLAQLDSDINDMYKMYVDPITGQLSDAGKQAITTYIGNYGGSYAPQLYSKWGISQSSGAPVDPDTYIQGVMRSAGAQGFNTNQIRDDLASFMQQGRLTAAQVSYILKNLGLQ